MKSIFEILQLKQIVMLSVIFMCLLGCSTMQATPYAPANNEGKEGYSHMKVSDNQYRVLFSGNENTDETTIKDYVMLHAAQLTLNLGYEWFVIADSETNIETKEVNLVPPASINQPQTTSTCGIVGCAIPNASRTETTTENSDTAIQKIVKDNVISSLLITIGKGQSSAAERIFDARELMTNLSKDK